MARVLADHADNILPLHDLTRFTKSFYWGSHFHGWRFYETKNAEISSATSLLGETWFAVWTNR